MRNILLILFFFVLNGCSLNSLLVLGEVDKVQVVKHTPYVKHHRAYFTRTHLKPMKNGKKYLYLYNAKEKDLAILFHRKNQYILYSLSQPNKKALTVKEDRRTKYHHILRSFKRKGYRLTSTHKVGYTSRIGLRRYKGIKTLLVEVVDYSRLKEIYEKAIRTYDAKAIRSIKTTLPKPLIYPYYERYHRQAKNKKQLEQLQIIAAKLQFYSAISIPSASQKKAEEEVQKELKREREQELERERERNLEKKREEERKRENEISKKRAESYHYYSKEASFDELDTYLSRGGARDHLTYNQYNKLKERHTALKKERVLHEGSLEELISAYKINKDPRYKKRILILMKEVQESK